MHHEHPGGGGSLIIYDQHDMHHECRAHASMPIIIQSNSPSRMYALHRKVAHLFISKTVRASIHAAASICSLLSVAPAQQDHRLSCCVPIISPTSFVDI